MSEERKRPVWPWIVATLIAVPVFYVASFGPACWLYNWKGVGESTIPVAYYPVILLSECSELNELTRPFATGGRCPAMYPAISIDGEVRWFVDLPEHGK